MQYYSFLAAALLGLCMTGEVLAQGNNGGKGQGGNGKGNQGNNNAGNNGGNQNKNNNGNNNGGGNNGDLTLDADVVQKGSQSDGQQAEGSAAGQAASKTDNANFINFCKGKTLTNGLQVKGGSCNGITMGDIPSTDKMISTIITKPKTGEDVEPNQTFQLQAAIQNLEAGSFTNPDATYYAAPQQLGNGGQVIGHTHFTVQDMGNTLNPQLPMDAQKFTFFKGVNDAGQNGVLSATVQGGLKAGVYRVCTITSASNHQAVNMPVAQRGAQDDCTKFSVGQGNGNQQGVNLQGVNQQGAKQQDGNKQGANQQAANAQDASAQDANQQSATQQAAVSQNATQQVSNQQGSNKQGANQQESNQQDANKQNGNQDSGLQQDAGTKGSNQTSASQQGGNQKGGNQKGGNQKGGSQQDGNQQAEQQQGNKGQGGGQQNKNAPKDSQRGKQRKRSRVERFQA